MGMLVAPCSIHRCRNRDRRHQQPARPCPRMCCLKGVDGDACAHARLPCISDIRSMLAVTEAGGIDYASPVPAFYALKTVDDIVNHTVAQIKQACSAWSAAAFPDGERRMMNTKAFPVLIAWTAAAQTSFAPLQTGKRPWKQRIPPPSANSAAEAATPVLVGKVGRLPDELRYWTGLKAARRDRRRRNPRDFTRKETTKLVLQVRAFKGYGPLVASRDAEYLVEAARWMAAGSE